MCMTYLEVFILEHLLNRNILELFRDIEETRLIDEAGGAGADDLAVAVRHLSFLPGFAVLCNDFNDLARIACCC